MIFTPNLRLAWMLSMALFALPATYPIANAGEVTAVSAKLSLSFQGLPVGEVRHTVTLNGDKYKITGVVETNTLIKLVSGVEASFNAIGTAKGQSIEPRVHNVRYKQRKKNGKTKIAFRKDRVRKVSAKPAIRYKPTVIKVTDKHKKDVLDPVSALLFTTTKGHGGAAVCNRTLPVFDGKERFDLVVRHVSTKREKVTGYRGPVHTCSVRYVPVAGHRPEKKSVQHLAANRKMRIQMARLGKSNSYGLFGFTVATDKGTARGIASKFKVQ